MVSYRIRVSTFFVALLFVLGPLLVASEDEVDDLTSTTFVMKLASLKQNATGEILVRTYREWAPLGVDRFLEMVEAKVLDEARFFRVVPDFMVQFGIPAIPLDPSSFPKLQDDPVIQSNRRGTISFATSGPNTRTTQLFINTRLRGNDFLDGQGFAPIGEVISGMNFVDEIYKEYGESPSQYWIQQKGNEYLKREYPLLSYIEKLETVDEDEADNEEPDEESDSNNEP